MIEEAEKREGSIVKAPLVPRNWKVEEEEIGKIPGFFDIDLDHFLRKKTHRENKDEEQTAQT